MLLLPFKKRKKKIDLAILSFKKIHQTNYNINDKRLVFSPNHVFISNSSDQKNQLQTAASLILTDKSLSTETPTRSLLMENKQWINGEFFEM